MPSIFELLEEIEKRPGAYVGGSGANRGQQLQNLELLLYGYAHAVQQHSLNEPVENFPRELGHYLHERFGWSRVAGPVAAIRESATDDDEAWAKFWALTWEFRRSILGDSGGM